MAGQPHAAMAGTLLDSTPGLVRTLAYWATLGLIFVIPIENLVDVSGVGHLGKAVGLAATGVWVAAVVLSGRVRRPHLFHVVACLFVLWNAASLLWSVDVEETKIHLLTYFQLLGLSLILWDLFPTRAAVHAGLQAYVLGASVSIASLVGNYLSGTRFSHIRYSAAGLHVDTIGVIFALGVPIAFYLAATRGEGLKALVWRWINLAYVPAALLGIALTGTRTAMVATVPALLLATGTLGRLRPVSRVLVFALIAGSLFALPSLVPRESLERLASAGSSIAEGDLSGRVRIWKDCFALISEHPVLGVGSGAIRSALATRRVAHNSFISVMTELGIVGFVLFAALLAVAFAEGLRQPRFESRFWLVLLLAWALGASTLTWEPRKQTWLVLTLAVVSANVTGTSEPPRSGAPRRS